jgi:glyoxylase-like metal-dependent hydrolase (beta-lactamase superfamily II)
MIALSTGVSYVDLNFTGIPRIIGTGVLHGPGGVALIDPGPSTSLPTLIETLGRGGIRFDDITAVLLTHIHLDHAGGTGTLVRQRPDLRVYVHEKGAPHLVDPAKLVSSATRLYGDAMQRLWGEIVPVPSGNLVMLAGGERLSAGSRRLDVAYTPGHASSHVSFFDGEAGIAWVGDTGGARILPNGPVMPATAPPEIDLPAWKISLQALDAWHADTWFVTHFGPSSPAAWHRAEFAERLEETAALAKRSLEMADNDADRERWFCERVHEGLRRSLSEAETADYELASRPDFNWKGLARYWRKNA